MYCVTHFTLQGHANEQILIERWERWNGVVCTRWKEVWKQGCCGQESMLLLSRASRVLLFSSLELIQVLPPNTLLSHMMALTEQ